MATGGNSVDNERMSQLEREVTGISTDVKYIVKMMDTLATKAELNAIDQRVNKIESSHKEKVTNLLSIAAIIVSVWAIYHQH